MNSEQKGGRRRKRVWWLGVLLGISAAAFLFCTFPCFESFYASVFPDLWSQQAPSVSRFDPLPKPFDRTKWQRGYATDRMAMGKWLEANGTLIGMRRAEVVGMLGEPEREYEEKDGGRQFRWELGEQPTRIFLSWIYTFIVELDHTGKVTKAWVYVHD